MNSLRPLDLRLADRLLPAPQTCHHEWFVEEAMTEAITMIVEIPGQPEQV
jgi:hypothetical protein